MSGRNAAESGMNLQQIIVLRLISRYPIVLVTKLDLTAAAELNYHLPTLFSHNGHSIWARKLDNYKFT